MNCEEFRRRLLEDPASRDRDFLAHREQCPPCAGEAREIERMEAELARLARVEPPPDLKERLRRPSSSRSRLPLAMAASLAGLLAVGVLLWSAGAFRDADSGIVTAVLDHVIHEPEALMAQRPLPADELRKVSQVVRLDPAALKHDVTYAMPCEVMNGPGIHLVLRVEEEPVTLLVVARKRISEPRLIQSGSYRGVVRPIANGSLAIIGGSSSPVEALSLEMTSLVRVGS